MGIDVLFGELLKMSITLNIAASDLLVYSNYSGQNIKQED